ncbi:receptor-like protein 19 [Medicago truncatula]|uniref:receptor-like protein 19 n=1 Tax=Medicago truncatula TaxID=3880 RepID=UPI0019687588|nr:receptor-like protein 19 [Medicago truncatula]
MYLIKQNKSSMGWLFLCLVLLLFNFPYFSSSSFNFSCHHDESSALLQFKSSFTMHTYYDGCGEPLLKTTTWKNETDCCSWPGVTCDTVYGRVVGLNLGCDGLQDMSSIKPNSMDLLFNHSSTLVTLNLADTGLSGNLKNNILCLPGIQELDMSQNFNLQGKLPELSCSASLSNLHLSNCQFQGPIPLYFSNLTHLTSLILSYNNLNNSIPSSLFKLRRLTHLHLSFNSFSGQIPDVFGGMTKCKNCI